ncbi:MAG TPA: hypothetical protein VJL58_02535 [Pyrinomonadaceae bacterium]|nr:hypothetical protein [Pyrinomonadaceae bacterium]
MLIDIIPLNDLTTESDTHTETTSPRVERHDRQIRRVASPGGEQEEGREIYMRARAIFRRASRTRSIRAAAIL